MQYANPNPEPPRHHGAGEQAGPPRKTFFYTLDGIRGVAALLIVLRHTESLFFPLRLQESYLAVDVFFVLSGVVISQAYGARLRSTMSFRQFAWIRIVRIMPLYLLGTLVSIVALTFGLMSVGSWHYAVFYATLAAFMIPNPGIGTIDVYPLNNPAWSLPLELLVNIAYANFIGLLNRTVIFAVMAVSMLGIAYTLYRAQSHSLNIGFWARSFPLGIFRVGYSFFAGVIIFDHHARKRICHHGRRQNATSWAIILAVASLLACYPNHRIQPYFDFAAVIFLFPLSVYLALLVQPDGSSAAVFKFLGTISYAIYTLHAPISGAVEGLYEVITGSSLARFSPAAGIVFLLLLVPVCFMADRFYDTPVRQRLLHRMYLPSRQKRPGSAE